MKNLGKRIKEIRKALGLTQEMFATKIYIDRGYLSQVERGKKQPSALVLLAIQNMFGVSREWLLAGKGPQRDFANLERALDQANELAKEQRKEFDRLVLTSKLLGELVKVPGETLGAIAGERLDEAYGPGVVEGLVQIPLVQDAAAAGDPRAISDHDIEGYFFANRSWCKRPADYVCVRVAGDSMAPVLPDGAIVGIHLKSRSPQRLAGKLVAARHDGGVVIKELAKARDHWLLLSYNKKYEPIVLDPFGEDNPIIGKVAWWWARQSG